MTTTDRERLIEQLVMDEGVRLFPYLDTVGKWTIGIGRNLTDVGITRREAFALLDHDIDKAITSLVQAFPWVTTLDTVRVAALANLVTTLAAVERRDYPAAADGLRNSRWYQQVQKSRSERIIRMVLTGRWPDEDRA